MYYGLWECKEDVLGDFVYCPWDYKADGSKDLKKIFETVNILIAWYDCEEYEGSAFVLFIQDGKLYEVHGYCSCFGLEDQWDPEETTVKSIRHRMEKGREFVYETKDRVKEMREVLKYCELLDL